MSTLSAANKTESHVVIYFIHN